MLVFLCHRQCTSAWGPGPAAPPTPSAPRQAMVDSQASDLSAAQSISHYSGDEWEVFIDELVEGIQSAKGYVHVKRMGGPGDFGIDVAAFKSARGLEGPWDCYQCKQYSAPLAPAQAWTEILKILRAVVAGECVMPDEYWFAAPNGIGLRLDKLLSQPTKAKQQFVDWLGSQTPVPALDVAERAKVGALVTATDFSRFDSLQPRHIITLHAETRYHALRFNSPLPERNDEDQELGEYTGDERRYVDQLIAAYQERHPDDDISRNNVADHATRGGHFKRQRQAFFRAEALRVYARESTPDGTFDALQGDVHAGVVEHAESDHVDAYTRAQSVLAASANIDLSSHRLIERADNEDRKGMCHQLVNDERLSWVEKE